MNTKKSIIIPQLLIAALFCLVVPQRSTAALSLTNGDFQDLTGLTNHGGGWYAGVPAGWSSSTASLTFNVIDYSSGNLGANLQTLGPSSPTFTPLYQSVGLLPSTGNVTLSFNILGLSATYGMAAGIWLEARWSPDGGAVDVLAGLDGDLAFLALPGILLWNWITR